jgi:hypothetical protein
MDDEVIFAQPGFVGANERGGGALQSDGQQIVGTIFQLGDVAPAVGLRDERIPIAFERQFHFDADDSVVVIFGGDFDAFAGVESHQASGLDGGRALEAQMVRDRVSEAGAEFDAFLHGHGAEDVEADGFGHVVEE